MLYLTMNLSLNSIIYDQTLSSLVLVAFNVTNEPIYMFVNDYITTTAFNSKLSLLNLPTSVYNYCSPTEVLAVIPFLELQSVLKHKVFNGNSGIYTIFNCISGKCYPGSAADLFIRPMMHYYGYDGTSNIHLQNSIKLYGKEAFVLFVCHIWNGLADRDTVRYPKENLYLSAIPKSLMYNTVYKATGGCVSHTPETLATMRKNNPNKREIEIKFHGTGEILILPSQAEAMRLFKWDERHIANSIHGTDPLKKSFVSKFKPHNGQLVSISIRAGQKPLHNANRIIPNYIRTSTKKKGGKPL